MLIRKISQLLLLLLPFAGSSQSRYNFFTIGVEQGLSAANVWSINQDKYGFIWIATTNGVNRYDGHSIKQYFHEDANQFSIPGNTVYWIFRDSDGDLWFACGHDGLAKYNYALDRFEKFAPYDSMRQTKTEKAPIWRIGEDRQKRIYFGCGAACFRYQKSTGKMEDITPLFKGTIEDAGIGGFTMQGNDIMWIPTDNGIYKYNLAAESIEQVPFDFQKMGYGSIRMYDAALVGKEDLLITTERAGFVLLNTSTLQFRPAPDPFNPAVTKVFTETGEVLRDSRGRFWLASSVYGLVEYFPETGKTVSMKKEMLYPYPYPEQEGSGKTIFEDRDGNIWYGTSTQGVIRFQPGYDFISLYKRDYSTNNTLADNYTTAFLPLGERKYWIGTHKNISTFNANTNEYVTLPRSIDLEGTAPGPIVFGFSRFKDTIFIGTGSGLSYYVEPTKTWKRFVNKSEALGPGNFSIPGNALGFVFHTQPGELIISNIRAARFNTASGKAFYKENSTEPDPLYSYKKIGAMAIDKNNHRIWLTQADSALTSYDYVRKTSTEHPYQQKEDTAKLIYFALAADSEGKLWMGSNNGLRSYDPATKQSETFIISSEPSKILNVNFTPGLVWFSTNKEIGRFNKRTKKIDIFNMRAIFPYANFMRRSLSVDDQNNLLIGTNQGFIVIDAGRFKANTVMSSPQLVSFKVFDKTKTIDRAYSEADKIELSYEENFFSFDFSSFNYQQLQFTQYAYMLEKFDKNWNYTTKNTASYTNVPPGTYKLLIKSASNSGQWNNAQRAITIVIKPPFWQTGWFIALCTASLIAFIYWIYRTRESSYKRVKIENTIDYFANSVYGENSVNEICWDIARNCISQLHFEDCVVYLKDEKRNVLVQKAAYGPKNPKGHEIKDPIEIEMGQGIVGTVAATGKALLIDDTTKDKRYIVDDQSRMSELSVPIMHDGEVIGVVDSEHSRKYFFTEEHLKALSTIASISANKIAEAKAEAMAKENEIKLLEINKLLAESQLMALRAQMNPHFVFNCLNSIQECIVTQKYGDASKYLNKFSKLFRIVLNNSGKNVVTIQEEKDVLQLYLDLEHMRFEKTFDYEIIVDDELEVDEIKIPSMLLQPYVENALWHGLMHKEGPRSLTINFKRLSEELFRCTIEDNGIGRKKSFELKEKQSKAKRHESKGMRISKDRLDLLHRQNQYATINIIDKYDEAGEAMGTAVVIDLSTFLTND
ncbi:MAG: histidine kinase [Gemmatimonadaceae bacterium]|nr:histidine kinase [Chitinophagaceae bacterium]